MARKTELEVDSTALLEAMNLYQKVTKKDEADVVNRAARNAVLGGGNIAGDKSLGKLKGAIQLTEKMKSPKLTPFNPTKKRGRKDSNDLMYALLASGKPKNNKFSKTVKGQGIAAKAEKLFNARKSAAGYAKAVWIGVGKKLGAKLKSKFELGGRATKATPVTLTARFTTADIDDGLVREVMEDALQKGMNNAAQDMRIFALNKMEERAREFSG